MQKNLYAGGRRVWPFFVLGLAIFAILIAQEHSTSAEPMRRLTTTGPPSSQFQSIAIWLKVAGSIVAVCINYWLAFSNAGIFLRVLSRGAKPLSAYGTAWSVFFVGCTVCAIAIFFGDLLPADWSDRTPWVEMYWRHVVVAISGTALAVLSLCLFRSPANE